MKIILAYFSQTGNTRKIAQAINTGIKTLYKDSDIRSIKDIKPEALGAYDLIGLGSPVWASRESPNVTAFISTLSGLEGKYAFTFCTHGATPSGFVRSIVPALQKKGMKVIGFYDCYGECRMQVLPKPYLTDGHPDDIDLKEAEDFGRIMAELAQLLDSGKTDLVPGLPEDEWDGILVGKPVGMLNEFENMKAVASKNRRINPDTCTGCGLCADNCPLDSIDMSVTPPSFKSTCFGCYFCEAVCPEGAIEMDFGPLSAVHDNIVRSIFMKNLAESEAAGRFRRLVPVEDIGWDTHWYQITGHPRYVVE